jgi:hypothetical protein
MSGEENGITASGKGKPRIVAGVHGTAASDAALDWAAREARLCRAQLHLVLARDPAVSRRAPYAHPAAPAFGDADAVWLAGAAVRAGQMLPQGRVTTESSSGWACCGRTPLAVTRRAKSPAGPPRATAGGPGSRPAQAGSR